MKRKAPGQQAFGLVRERSVNPLVPYCSTCRRDVSRTHWGTAAHKAASRPVTSGDWITGRRPYAERDWAGEQLDAEDPGTDTMYMEAFA